MNSLKLDTNIKNKCCSILLGRRPGNIIYYFCYILPLINKILHETTKTI